MPANLETMSKTTVGKRIAANTGLMVGAKFFSVTMGLSFGLSRLFGIVWFSCRNC